MRAKNLVKKFLQACIDSENFEANPILQDYMTPETVPEIEKILGRLLSDDVNTGDWHDMVDLPGPFIVWRDVDGKDYIFRVLGDVKVDKLRGIKKSATFEDHLEELYLMESHWYRHAGGGRGFYWTEELEVVWCGE